MSISRIDRKYFLLAIGSSYVAKDSDEDIAVRCPICGDSRQKKRSARLHLYSKGEVTNVNCFNGTCAAQNKSVYGFLRDFFPNLLSNYKKEVFGTTIEKLKEGTDVFGRFRSTNYTTQKVEKVEKVQKVEQAPVQVQDLSIYMSELTSASISYIEKRGFDANTVQSTFGKWFYGHQDLKIGEVTYPITNSIIIPLYYDGTMYGFYSRNIESKSFYTYMNNANIGYKIFNWFNIDKNEPTYIYEGIFDAIAGGFKNSIALMGAKIPKERLDELKNPIFVLDNDKTGLLNSLEYSKKHKVYVQPDKYKEKDANELMLNLGQSDTTLLIKQNIFSGIMAEVRIRGKL